MESQRDSSISQQSQYMTPEKQLEQELIESGEVWIFLRNSEKETIKVAQSTKYKVKHSPLMDLKSSDDIPIWPSFAQLTVDKGFCAISCVFTGTNPDATPWSPYPLGEWYRE